MKPQKNISCRCGRVSLQLAGQPIISTECLCNSCREAGEYLQSRPGAQPLLDDKGATHMVLYRKDRVQCTKGADSLREYRLAPDSKTRRVIAACCDTPMFLDFTPGHWLSLYGRRWPETALPPVQLRTMVRDRPEGTSLPDDIRNAETHSLAFFAKLVCAWAAMGFRTPQVDFVNGAFDTH